MIDWSGVDYCAIWTLSTIPVSTIFFPPVKKLSESREKYAQIKLNFKQIFGWILIWEDNWGWTFSLDYYLWISIMFLSADFTLILTAPIHCRGSIVEKVIQCYISQTHLHLGWQIFILGWTIPFRFLFYTIHPSSYLHHNASCSMRFIKYIAEMTLSRFMSVFALFDKAVSTENYSKQNVLGILMNNTLSLFFFYSHTECILHMWSICINNSI